MITCKLHYKTDPRCPQVCVGYCGKTGRKMVLWSAQILEHVKVRTVPLNWRKEISHGRLGATLTLLGKMGRHP